MAALSRIANNDHQIKVGPGDTVVLASSLIPGNENAVSRVINGLTRLGAKVVHKGNAMVHVSGHAAAGELLYCYNIVKPRNVIPVHGEWRHMRANAEIATSVGIPRERVLLADDGVVVDLVEGVASIVGYVPVGFVYVDGIGVGDLRVDVRVAEHEGVIGRPHLRRMMLAWRQPEPETGEDGRRRVEIADDPGCMVQRVESVARGTAGRPTRVAAGCSCPAHPSPPRYASTTRSSHSRSAAGPATVTRP